MVCKGGNTFRCLKACAATAAILAAIGLSPTVRAAEQGNWVPTWAASPQPVWEPDFIGGVGVPRSLRDQTVRQIGRVSIGGDRVRFIVSNEYGKEPLARISHRRGLVFGDLTRLGSGRGEDERVPGAVCADGGRSFGGLRWVVGWIAAFFRRCGDASGGCDEASGGQPPFVGVGTG